MSAWARFPRRHPVWTTAAVLIVAIVVTLALFDWNWARGPVQRAVSSKTDREFRIDGDLDVDYFPLEVHAERVYFSNARWASEETMARTERVDMRVRFWPLLAGRVTLPYLALDRPYLRLERNKDGIGNWTFSRNKPIPAASKRTACRLFGCTRLRIHQLNVQGGDFEFVEPTLRTSIDLRVDSAKPTRDGAFAPLKLNGSGTYRKAPFDLRGQVDSPLALQGKPSPYRVDLRARAGETIAHAHGTLTEPLRWQDANVNFELQGPDLARIYEFAGLALPTTPPYALKGRLTRRGDRFSYQPFSGTIGDSDISGNATIDIGGKRPKLTAVLKSNVLDFDDLAGFVGGTPGTGKGETASSEQQQAASERRASGRFLPVRTLHIEKLRSMDADVRLTAARVDSQKLPLEAMTAHLKLVDGKLTVNPLDFGAAGGKLASVVYVDARHEPLAFELNMQIQQLDLPRLTPKAKLMQDSIGRISGFVELQGQGDSIASALATSHGNIGAIMGEGQISNLLLEVAGLDIAEALALLIGGDQKVAVRCAYADFNVVDGVATARSVAFDTTDTALLLRGDIDFKDETLDMKLLPRPKDKSPLALRTPIHIGGTLADPSIGLEGEPLMLRGALVTALAALAPPLALLGLIERGPGKDSYCGTEPLTKKKNKEKKKDKDADSNPDRTPGPRPAS